MISADILQFHLDTIKMIIDRKLPISDQRAFVKSIEALGFYLRKQGLNATINLKIFSKPCCVCGEHIREINKKQSIALNCGHFCCKDTCLQTLVRTSNTNLLDWIETKCPICGLYVHENTLINAFGGKSKFDKLLADYEESKAAKFTCNICFMEWRVDQSITLDCDHRYNPECIGGLLDMAINESRVNDNDLACPECGKTIGPAIIRGLVEKSTWAKYEKFKLRNFEPEEKEPIVFYKCEGNDCEYFEIVHIKIQAFKCPLCGTVKCPKCRDEPHRGITCDENFKRKKDEEERVVKERKDQQLDDEFKEAARKLGFKTCPHCKSMCEKISGCKFMRCYSPHCKGKNNFCLLCECPLTEAQHYSHYKAKGPFGEICNTMDGNKD